MIRLFLDANVLFAVAASPHGGSARLLEECRHGKYEAVVSRLVLLEAERNIRKKLPSSALKRYRRILGTVPFSAVQAPSLEALRTYRPLINEKDVPILAAALASRASYLVTLDRRLVTDRLRAARLPIRFATPGEILQAQ